MDDGARARGRGRADPVDAALDDESYDAGQRIEAPLLALWGADGVMASLPILDLWREYHRRPEAVRGRAIEGRGHFVPEEAAEVLITELRSFLSPGPTG